ncbi:MAG TPA: type II toxin-antitoxin system VapC family toxin [Planctomycetota bacterium]|nr:type II toxin-antitoxin system VapC family toxin [Planctomycetota bacterium]
MGSVLVDANVILDLLTEDERWSEWSSNVVEELAETHALAINPIVYAEISIRFSSIEDLESALSNANFERLQIPWEAAFLAAKCHLQYRKRGGKRVATLPDFFVGAHALVAGLPLLTRDSTRYKTYFPKLQLIAPKV